MTRSRELLLKVGVSRAHGLPDGDYHDQLYGLRADCALGSAANHRGQAHTDRSKMLSLGSSCVPLVASGKAERP